MLKKPDVKMEKGKWEQKRKQNWIINLCIHANRQKYANDIF